MILFDKIRGATDAANKAKIQQIQNSEAFKNEIIRISGDEDNPDEHPGILMTKALQGKNCAEKVINASQPPYTTTTLMLDAVFQYFVSNGFVIRQSTNSQGDPITNQYDIYWN